MKKTIFIITAALILFTSCQKVVDADKLLGTEEKVFISSYISPQDTVLRVNVSKALPAIGTPLFVDNTIANVEKFLIKDAQVSISDEAGNSTSLIYSEEDYSYLAATNSLAILSEQVYFLEVTVAGETYTASCTIPKKVAEISERLNIREYDVNNYDIDVTLAFDDIVGERNFYVVGGQITPTVIEEESQDTITYSYPLYFDTETFLQDNVLDGTSLNASAESFFWNGPEVLQTILTLQVVNAEEVLFQNLRTEDTNLDAEGNPFAEYAIAPNTIVEEGAVGIFAGYQLTTKEIALE